MMLCITVQKPRSGRANSKRQDMCILRACRRAREGTFIDLYEAGVMRLTEISPDCLQFEVPGGSGAYIPCALFMAKEEGFVAAE
jgi:hypothetical protein